MRDDGIYIISVDLPVREIIDESWADEGNVAWEDDEIMLVNTSGWSVGGVVTAHVPETHWWDRLTSGFALTLGAILIGGLCLAAWFALQGPISKSDPPVYQQDTGENAKTHCRDWSLTRDEGARQGYAGCRVTP